MQRPRVFDFRSSTGPAALGLCATDIASICAYLNEAESRLVMDPLAPDEGWWGGWVRMAFNVSQTEPTFVTPANVARVILLDVCKHPVRINNEFYEFLEFGRGFQPQSNPPCQGPLMAYERETVTTFDPMVGTKIIRAYITDPADAQRTALIQGRDSNGQTVRFIDALTNSSGLGERIIFNQPFTDTANQFTGELIGVQKQKTFGEVQFFQVDATTGQESPLLVMQPGETTALFRKYYVNGLPTHCCNVPCGTTSTTLQVLAMCKLEVTPVSSDTDYLNIMSVPALIDECQSIRYSRMDIPGAQQLSAAKHSSALRLLFGQLDHYLGKERPALQRHIFGSNRMRTQPI